MQGESKVQVPDLQLEMNRIMGWDGVFENDLPYKNGKVDRKAYLDKTFTWDDGNGHSCEVLKSAMVGTTYYAAVKNQKGEIFALIALTAGKRGRNDSCGLYYKAMDETEGPYNYDCPLPILDMLSPTEHEWAVKWRNGCRERAKQKADERKNGKAPAPRIEGVTIEERRGSYIISSFAYRLTHCYVGVRYAKRYFKSAAAAQKAFIDEYGTDEQKAALAATSAA